MSSSVTATEASEEKNAIVTLLSYSSGSKKYSDYSSDSGFGDLGSWRYWELGVWGFLDFGILDFWIFGFGDFGFLCVRV